LSFVSNERRPVLGAIVYFGLKVGYENL